MPRPPAVHPPTAAGCALAGCPQVARRTDMDANGHINNVTYLAWALETLPSEVYNTWHLAELEIDFKAGEAASGRAAAPRGRRRGGGGGGGGFMPAERVGCVRHDKRQHDAGWCG